MGCSGSKSAAAVHPAPPQKREPAASEPEKATTQPPPAVPSTNGANLAQKPVEDQKISATVSVEPASAGSEGAKEEEKAKQGAAAPLPGSVEDPPPATPAAAVSSSEKTAAPPAAPLRLVPVKAAEAGISEVFKKYKERLDTRLCSTLDCSWAKLEEELAKDKAGGTRLEWYWALPAGGGSATEPNAEEMPGRLAEGLVVFRFMKGNLANFAQIHHVSAVGKEFLPRLGYLLDAVRQQLFLDLPIAQIRTTLFYSEGEDGKYNIDQEVETIFKERHYRWFQLTNERDGRRGQIMAQRRNEEIDAPKPPEAVELDVKLCLLLPMPAGGTVDEALAGGAAFDEAEGGSHLMLVECLRRYELEKEAAEAAQKAAASEAENKENVAPPPEGGEGENAAPKPTEEEQKETGGTEKSLKTVKLADLVKIVREKWGPKSLPKICTKQIPIGEEGGVAEALQKCEKFCTSLLEEDPTGPSLLDRKELPRLSTMLTEELGNDPECKKATSLVCGLLSVTGNTLRDPSKPVDAADPKAPRLSLPVTLVGTSPSAPAMPGTDKGFVLYVCTADDDLNMVLWSYSKEATEKATSLDNHCAEVLGSVEQFSGEPITEVSLPIFGINGRAGISRGGDSSQKKPPAAQLLEVSLGTGRPRPGVLGAADADKTAQPIRLEGPFVFCVCHSELDTLDRPLFATVIDPEKDCGPAAPP